MGHVDYDMSDRTGCKGHVRTNRILDSRIRGRASVAQHRLDPTPVQPPAPAEGVELDQEEAGGDPAAEAIDELAGRLGGAAGRQEIVDDQDPLAGDDRVGVDLQASDPLPDSVAPPDLKRRPQAGRAHRYSVIQLSP